MDSFIGSSSLPSTLDENLALLWHAAEQGGDCISPESTPWNTTSSGLESDYNLFQGSLTHQSDVRPPPWTQPASGESQPPLLSFEQEILELRNENTALKAKNTVLETENNAYRAILNVLYGPTAGGSPARPMTLQNTAEASNVTVLVPLQRIDYPLVKFWYRRDWNKHETTRKAAALKDHSKMVARGKGRSTEGINVMMLYIETEDGRSVDGDVARDIRQTARTLWDKWARANPNLPSTWTQVDEQSKTEYFSKMAETYPYIRLCHQDWKANLVATSCYSKWHLKWKGNAEEPEPEVGSGGIQNKRSRKDSMTTMQKRPRPDVVDPAFPVVASLDSEPGDAVTLDGSMPTTLLPDYFAIPSAITGGPSTYSQAPPEMYLGPDILKRYEEVSEEKKCQGTQE